jgi:hypothetical protein
MKELSLALTLILTGLGMSQSKQFNPGPHAPPAAVEAISVGRDNPDAQATVATVAPADDQAVALLTTDDGEANASADKAAQADDANAAGLLVTRQSRGSTGAPSPEDYRPTLAEQMLATANRLGPYRSLDPALCQAAQQYADYLARTRQQGHFADQGPEERAKRAGFTGSLRGPVTVTGPGTTKFGLGEVLAFGHPDIEAAFEGWMNSKGHREALQEPLYDVAGFGRNGRVFVGLFGNSKAAPPKLATAAAPTFTQCQPGQPCYQPRQSQPVYRQPQQTYRGYSQCGPGGCGPAYQRRGLFGRR